MFLCIFQSTLPRGSDRLSMRILYCASTFQSTLPRGSDVHICRCRPNRRNFNPRSLAGATLRNDVSNAANAISIHAPSRERLERSQGSISGSRFQSTLPRGSDAAGAAALQWRLTFQSTLPRGSDTGARTVIKDNLIISIHAPSRERQ